MYKEREIIMSINPHFRNHINFRDLGGYVTEDGRKIKPGMIFRSGGIYLMNDDELSYLLNDLGIKYIMDLRTSAESNVDPNPNLPGVEMVRYSGLVFRGGEEIDFSPVGMSKIGKEGEEQLQALSEYYSGMPFDNEAFSLLIKSLREEKVPLVFHCATGKDRTGVAAMIVLAALGVPRETIMEDYVLSNDYHKDTIEKVLAENQDRLSNHPELDVLIRMRTGVTREMGELVLNSMYTRYGSIDSYLEEEFGLRKEGLGEFRDNYLL